MGREFNVPAHFRSPIISVVKRARSDSDPRKRDLTPTNLDFGPLRIKIARHFGFCYGVENAIEIAYRALAEHPGRRIFLLSEMIHNPRVNGDLQARGVRFLRSTDGTQLIPFELLTPDDIVIIPAFGTTIEIDELLSTKGVDTRTYDTTCPFVTKVWRRSEQIGAAGYTVVVHGKRYHEETRATMSHAGRSAPVVVIRDEAEARILAAHIRGEADPSRFFESFPDRCSPEFDPTQHLGRIGVVNQTTMLATETRRISELLRDAMIDRHGPDAIDEHFADTSDTLCYATNENQNAAQALIDSGADLAIVVGGYNSSNTSHLVELCEERMPTYFVSGASELESPGLIRHFDYANKRSLETHNWLPVQPDRAVELLLTAGASCPDALLDEVIQKMLAWFPEARPISEVLSAFTASIAPAAPPAA